jgi:hypothetical protein
MFSKIDPSFDRNSKIDPKVENPKNILPYAEVNTYIFLKLN